MGGIYGWRFRETGEIKYVGKTKNFKRRESEHTHNLSGKCKCRALTNAFLKYGVHKFEFVVLQDNITDDTHAILAEGLYARQYKTLVSMKCSGYNIRDPWDDRLHTAQWRLNIANANKRTLQTESWRRAQKAGSQKKSTDLTFKKKCSENGKARMLVPEYKEKFLAAGRVYRAIPENRERLLSKLNQGFKDAYADPIHREKMKATWRAVVQTQEWQEKHSLAMQKVSDDPVWRRHITESNQRKVHDPIWKEAHKRGIERRDANPNKIIGGKPKRQVLCIETNVIYESVSDAARKHNISISNLCSTLKGRLHSCGGFHWCYVDCQL